MRFELERTCGGVSVAFSSASHGWASAVLHALESGDDAPAPPAPRDGANHAEGAVLLALLGSAAELPLLRALAATCPTAPLLILSPARDPETVVTALRAGARGYLLSPIDGPSLRAALAEVRAGGSPLSKEIARHVVDAVAGRWQDTSPLTNREREVLALLARGHRYSDVAAALGIRLGTVQTHVKTIYEKLAIASKAEAALAAERLRVV